MSNLREAYAATALAGLGWDDNAEKAIDRVAASGKATALGVFLWKAKYQLESRAYQSAIKEALSLYMKRYRDSRGTAERLVDQAMREYIAPACRLCSGRGEMVLDELKVICATCEGSKTHRFTDTERATAMQLSYALTKHCAFKIKWLLGLFGDEDKRVNYILNIELERIDIDNSKNR